MKKNNDFSKIISKTHENKWVALSADQKEVVAYSQDLISLEKKVGDKKVVYMKVPTSGVLFAF